MPKESFSFDIDKFESQFRFLQNRAYPKAMGDGLRSAGNALYDDVAPLVPMSHGRVDSGGWRPGGLLRSSALLTVSMRHRAFYLSFGPTVLGALGEANHALLVHDMDPQTNWTTPGTQEEYLKEPAEEGGGRGYLMVWVNTFRSVLRRETGSKV